MKFDFTIEKELDQDDKILFLVTLKASPNILERLLFVRPYTKTFPVSFRKRSLIADCIVHEDVLSYDETFCAERFIHDHMSSKYSEERKKRYKAYVEKTEILLANEKGERD